MFGKDAKGAMRTLDQALNVASMIPVKDSMYPLNKPETIALLAAVRVDTGDLRGTLAWAAAHSNDAVAKASALVGAAVALLRPSERVGSRVVEQLLPPM
jgi:hypothetical protein